MTDLETAIAEFMEAAADAGLLMPERPEGDGELHRFHIEGDRHSVKNGWYVLHLEPIPAGAFGCWKRGVSKKWRSGAYGRFGEAEREQIRRRLKESRERAEKARKECQAEAAARGRVVLSRSTPADPRHPYLQGKQIVAHGLRQKWGKLIVPVLDRDGVVTSLQFIDQEGGKLFLKDGCVAGGSFTIGEPGGGGDILLCEGFATGASLHEATGKLVVCAFNAGNLDAVGRSVRDLYPSSRIVICADHDAWDRSGIPRPASENTGKIKARQAAAACHGLVVCPHFDQPEPGLTDFNDLHCTSGADAVSSQVEEGIQREITIVRMRRMGDTEYEAERRQIAACLGLRVGALDDLRIRGDGDDPDASEGEAVDQSVVDQLVRIGKDAELFTAPDGKAYGRFERDGHHENHSLHSTSFGKWLRHQYYKKVGKGVSDATVGTAVDTLAAVAEFEGCRDEVFIRCARHRGRIYIDLCDAAWTVIEVTSAGWEPRKDPPVRFIRKQGMEPLPKPEREGSLAELWPLLNIRGEQRALIAGFLVSALRGGNSYPVLNLFGTEGAAKTTATSILRRLIDPNLAVVASFPRSQDDLAISASSQFVPVFENVSKLSDRESDWVCRLATGSAIRKRELYTDEGEVIVKYCRPSIINGIPNVVSRGDLASRSISVELQGIDDSDRKVESAIEEEFLCIWPRLFGALLDGISHALRHEEEVAGEFAKRLPRMADAALFATAAEESFGFERGTFIRLLGESQGEAVAEILESSRVAVAIVKIVKGGGSWEGTASKLLGEIKDEVGDDWDRTCPKNAKALSEEISRLESALRKSEGITVERKKSGSTRLIILRASHSPGSPSQSGERASQCVPTKQLQALQTKDGTQWDAGGTQTSEEPVEHVTL